MKRAILLIALVSLLFTTCASAGAGGDRPSPDKVQPENPYNGLGGKGLSITILAPEGRGLAKEQDYIPSLVPKLDPQLLRVEGGGLA